MCKGAREGTDPVALAAAASSLICEDTSCHLLNRLTFAMVGLRLGLMVGAAVVWLGLRLELMVGW